MAQQKQQQPEQKTEAQRGLAKEKPSEGVARARSPFMAMRRFMEEVDRLFGVDRFFGVPFPAEIGRAMWTPSIDVFERDQNLVVRADLPGLTQDDITLTIEDDVLTISGKREETREARGVYEREYGSFYRAIALPSGVKAEEVRARFADGVLEITIPSKERTQGKTIKVESGASAEPTKH